MSGGCVGGTVEVPLCFCHLAGPVSQLPLYFCFCSALGCRGPVLQASWVSCERPLFKKGKKDYCCKIIVRSQYD